MKTIFVYSICFKQKIAAVFLLYYGNMSHESDFFPFIFDFFLFETII